MEGFLQIAIRFEASTLYTLQNQITILINSLEMTRRELGNIFKPPLFTSQKVIETEPRLTLLQSQPTSLFNILNNQIKGIFEDIKRKSITLPKQNDKKKKQNICQKKNKYRLGFRGNLRVPFRDNIWDHMERSRKTNKKNFSNKSKPSILGWWTDNSTETSRNKI